MLKWWSTALFLFTAICVSQEHADVFKLGLTHNFSAPFERTDFSTTVNSVDIVANAPLTPFNQNYSYILGADFRYYKTQLYPNTKPINLYSTTLLMGWHGFLSDQTGIYAVAMPKISSDYQTISTDDLYLGGMILMENHQSRRLYYRFGGYFSTEAYGAITTPVLGFYYISDDNSFIADVNLPFRADFSFKLEHFTLGLDYYAMNSSYRIYDIEDQDIYAEQKRMEFSGYFRVKTPSTKIWWQAKLGYAFNSLEAFDVNDRINFYILDFALRDERTQLNPDLRGSLFFKVEILYRLPL